MTRCFYLCLLMVLGASLPTMASEIAPCNGPTFHLDAPSPLLKKDSLERSLRRTIDEGIALLKQKKYETFLRRFVLPDEIDELNDEHGSIETFAAEFGTRKGAILLGVLKSIRSAKPRFNADRSEATYKVRIRNAPNDTIVWKMVDSVWYISN